MDYTQKELKMEFDRRKSKEESLRKLKAIDIYKLPDGTFSTEDPAPIRWFHVFAVVGLAFVIIFILSVGEYIHGN